MQTKSLCMQNCFRCMPMRMGNCAHKKTRHVHYILIITCYIGRKWQSPSLYCFLQPPPKSWIFHWTPKILKFFMLNTSLAPPPLLKIWLEAQLPPFRKEGRVHTMLDHRLVLENFSSAAVNTLPNIIIYLTAIRYLNIKLRQIFQSRI